MGLFFRWRIALGHGVNIPSHAVALLGFNRRFHDAIQSPLFHYDQLVGSIS